ncbi:MAG: ATP-binding protein [Campylobacteraceae bacterium]|jgi:predicted AAA+ superfamily ATPase|nr:ATP-binding protein [Campylobacteraceae bacterium]
MINWENTKAAVYRAKKESLKPVFDMDAVTLKDLLHIDEQKRALCENTQRFLEGKKASHALLWGSRGTGKSSLIKAVLNHFFERGLRIIEICKDDLGALTDISDEIRDLPYKFIIFCDDISFEAGDASYKALKSVIEGSIELPPKNILVYATSNRRHLIPEFHADNDGTIVKSGEIHYSDNVEEKISLSDRFGLWLSFYQGTLDEYLQIVDSYFPNLSGEKCDFMHGEAKRYAALRASRSGRTAKQFFELFGDKFS